MGVAGKRLAAQLPQLVQSGGFFARLDTGRITGIIIVAATFMVIMLVIVYIIALIKWQSFERKEIQKYAATVSQLDGVFDSGSKKLPATNTNSITYTFWVYLTNFVPKGYDSPPGLVWRADATPSSTASGNTTSVPSTVVFMTNYTNRMYMSFYLHTGETVKPYTALAHLIPDRTNVNGDMRIATSNKENYLTIPIDYVPLQRWVHYAIVINQATISVYQDSSLYAVRSSSDLEYYKAGSRTPDENQPRPIFVTAPATSVSTGKRDTTTTLTAKDKPMEYMYISSFYYYNYAVNQADLQRVYNRGPHATSSWLAWIGIGKWRLQSPIVRVDEDEITDEDKVDI